LDCLEKLITFSSPKVLPLIFPESVSNINLSYILDTGAEVIVREWIRRQRKALGLPKLGYTGSTDAEAQDPVSHTAESPIAPKEAPKTPSSNGPTDENQPSVSVPASDK
jgi:hypothetical protein